MDVFCKSSIDGANKSQVASADDNKYNEMLSKIMKDCGI